MTAKRHVQRTGNRTGGCLGLMEWPHRYFAMNRATDEGVSFTREERERHVYIVGKSGSGKTTTLFNIAMQDIDDGEGVTVIDPHGDLAEAIIDCIPPARTHDVCYLNVSDTVRPVGFNPLANIPAERRALAASGIVSAFRHLWSDSWGPRTEHLLYHGVRTLLDLRQSSLLDLPRLYTDDNFLQRALHALDDEVTHRFWGDEFAQYTATFRSEVTASILNKAGQFTTSPNLRMILGQKHPKFSLQLAMDNQKIFIANLSKGSIGESASNVLGSLLVSHIQLVAMSRSSIPPEQRVPHFIHVDEFQSFTTDAFASIFSEARKFAAHFCLANQYTEQVPSRIRAAVLGNAGSMLVFCVGAADAEILAPEFSLLPAVLSQQPPFQAWVKRGSAEIASIKAIPRIVDARKRREKIISQSQRHFGRTI